MIIKRQLVAWLVGDNMLTDVGAYVQGQIKGVGQPDSCPECQPIRGAKISLK
jgi:hypothetical protein